MSELTGTARPNDVSPRLSRSRRGAGVALALPLTALVIGALALPAFVSYALVARGVGEGHPSWVALGVIAGALWLLPPVGAIRRAIRGRRAVS